MTSLLMALARTLPLAGLAPPIGGPSRAVRALVALGLAVVMMPAAGAGLGEQPLVLVLGREALVGLTLGLVSAIPFHAAEAAGALVDHARRPAPHVEDRLYERLHGWLALALFAAGGGPRVWVTAIGESYVTLPVARPIAGCGAVVAIEAGARLVALGVALAAPAVLAAIVAELVVGLIRRGAPSLGVGGSTLAARELGALVGVALVAGAIAAALSGGLASLPQFLDGALRGIAAP